MGAKSESKKAYILEVARSVFAERGFKAVTMKDIVEACGISRGGLYLYYGSTRELFLEVIRKEVERNDSSMEKDLKDIVKASDIMMVYIKSRKKEILDKENSLAMAMYEFYAENPGSKKHILRNRFETGAKLLEKLIEMGVKEGEFRCESPELEARNMMYALEGMEIMNCTGSLPKNAFDREMVYLLSRIIVEV
ncbi:MAG: TetR/AcrR family transcriptional regulator [Lachnospiraceae bacterium]|nr:TetR/AcrR family transcriptional regulator [Lachnospiraceae bacterium]